MRPAHTDTADLALQTLLLPLQGGVLRWPAQGGLFLNGRDGWPLHSQALPGLVCVQAFRPEVDALERSGIAVASEFDPQRRFDLVMLLPPRQREASRAMYARALDHLQPGGILLAAQSNAEGAKSSEDDLARLIGPLQVLSKHKCRVFWSAAESRPDRALQDAWRDLDAPRPIAGSGFLSRPGVFAWDRIDAASRLLAEHLPADLQGEAADLGAGWGYLSIELLRRCPGITALDLFEADARALDLAQQNLAAVEPRRRLGFHWHDVTRGLPAQYDLIVCNPPFHTQQAGARPDIGRAFIAAAARALRPGGRLWLVANRHLPYEAALGEGFDAVRIHAQQDGFKIIEAVAAKAPSTRHVGSRRDAG